MVKQLKKVGFRDKLALRFGLVTSAVMKQIMENQEASRRSPIREDLYNQINRVIDVPYNYGLLMHYAWQNEVVRQVHDAIIRECVRNKWDVKPKWQAKCTMCGMEFQTDKEKCSECGGATRKPDLEQKQILQAFIDDPNPDNETYDIVKSCFRYMLSVDDWWLSIQYADFKAESPLTIYVEDSRNMRVVSDEKGRLGNGEYFCPECTGDDPGKIYQKNQKCKKHPNLELKETAYVYVSGADVKARFAKDEILHSMCDPLLPSLYGNSKLISCLKVILSIFAMDQFNLTTYGKGKLAQILCFNGMSQEQANTLQAEAQKQIDTQELDVRTGEKVANLLTLFLGATDKGVTKVDSMPPSEKMQSLEWWKLWREIVCSIYGVTPVFSGVVESGKSGNNPRMQIDVQNNTTEMYQKGFEEPFNNVVVPKLGVTDWLFKFNPVEEKDEMQDVTVLNAKLDALQKAVNLGLDAELTDEGEVKVGGKPLTLEEKNQMRVDQFKQTQPEGEQAFAGKKPFKQENVFATEKGRKTWLVKEVDAE
jgi:ribosomal protein L37E